MARRPRMIEDGSVYHVLNRGNNRADVFTDPSDHEAFLEALTKTRSRSSFELFGYCLMTNHFHLLLRPGSGQSLSRILQSLTVAHTWRHHKRHQSVGYGWQGRFKSPVVQEDGHRLVVLRSIEANPLRARMVEDLKDYPWSSDPAHGLGQPNPLLAAFPEWNDLGNTDVERRQRWRRRVAAPQDPTEVAHVRESTRTGRPLGVTEWVEATVKRLDFHPPSRPRGRPRKDAKQASAKAAVARPHRGCGGHKRGRS